jgi:crotonobetainyl-CoA:carnitine CoA-transferase CaiB-like acyl-CoA transferase
MTRPLEGIHILDLSRLNPGGYCTMLLADLGAEVLKVEQPGRGDYMRTTPPLISGQSSMFLTLNRNKKSLILNLKSEKGKEILLRLLDRYDILVESFRPGVTKRLGIDYETLARSHPKLIYCPITGYGQDGPYRDLVGHDINYLALAGVLSLTGKRDGPPIVPGITIADIAGSMFATIGIMTAIISRQNTGMGQLVDVSMFDGVVSWLTIQAARYFAEGKSLERETWPAGGEAFYDVYETKDKKYVSVGAAEEKFWQNLCQSLGAEELSRYKPSIGKKEPEAHLRLSEVFKSKTRDEWTALLMTKDVCLTPVKTLDEVFTDPHVRHRKLVYDMDYPMLGIIKQLAFPIKFSEIQTDLRNPPPSLGQHTDLILSELGFSETQVKQFRAEGVV